MVHFQFLVFGAISFGEQIWKIHSDFLCVWLDLITDIYWEVFTLLIIGMYNMKMHLCSNIEYISFLSHISVTSPIPLQFLIATKEYRHIWPLIWNPGTTDSSSFYLWAWVYNAGSRHKSHPKNSLGRKGSLGSQSSEWSSEVALK